MCPAVPVVDHPAGDLPDSCPSTPTYRGQRRPAATWSLIQDSSLCGEGFDIYSGNDDQTLPIMSLGGKGVVSVLANIMPKETHKMCRLYLDGRIEGEQDGCSFKLLEIMEALFWDVNPIPVKAALGLMGICGDDLRLPLTPMEPEQRERLAEVMKRQGISLKRRIA
ncbi:MAG: dihydrodipicolinate synthase family protein [Enterocloster sp.]